MTSPAVVFHCQACGGEVGYVYRADDDVVLAGRGRTTTAADEDAKRTGVDRRRHRRQTAMWAEFMLRGEGYTERSPEAWCPDHGRMTLPDREQLLAYFDKAGAEHHTIHVGAQPVG